MFGVTQGVLLAFWCGWRVVATTTAGWVAGLAGAVGWAGSAHDDSFKTLCLIVSSRRGQLAHKSSRVFDLIACIIWLESGRLQRNMH